QFKYDALGERVKKTSGTTTSLYPFGDDYEITNGVVTKYISIEGVGVVAKKVTGGSSPGTYWFLSDHLGSLQGVLDVNGLAISRRTYRPYGQTLGQSGSHTESRGWIDQRNDTETGLTYLHARYFDPHLGVFLSPDPIGVEGGLNQYGYVFGNPVNGTDRSGLAGFWANCGDGSTDSCWIDLAGLDVVVEVTVGGGGPGGLLGNLLFDRFATTPSLAVPAQVPVPDPVLPSAGVPVTAQPDTTTGNTIDNAGAAALEALKKKHERRQWEYGGLIFYDPGNPRFFYDPPWTSGGRTGLNMVWPSVQPGRIPAGRYHNHVEDEMFSLCDMWHACGLGPSEVPAPVYQLTPDDRSMNWDPADNAATCDALSDPAYRFACYLSM
ncbi:MAG: RHS repeat-associated core domain-containing protein, partial [Candidatus Nanopelagicales bacterium]|nr:RHS repeat-associated core domain-containing protein [Candidatus Nanopelagicales bacterium]